MQAPSKFTGLIFCIIANIGFFILSWSETGRIRITLLHFFCGIVPLIILSAKMLGDYRNKPR